MSESAAVSPGLFIAVEGADGSGKTTLAKHLVQCFHDLGHNALFTREFGGSPVAEKLRALIVGSDKSVSHEVVDDKASLLMILASRIQHQRSTIFPAVREGRIVVSDRCFDSTYVYQGVKRKQTEMLAMLENMQEISYLRNRPDITIFLDVSPDVSMERTLADDAKDNTFNEEGGLAERTFDIETYRDRMRQASNDRPGSIIMIDADAPLEELMEKMNVIASGILAERALRDFDTTWATAP